MVGNELPAMSAHGIREQAQGGIPPRPGVFRNCRCDSFGKGLGVGIGWQRDIDKDQISRPSSMILHERGLTK